MRRSYVMLGCSLSLAVAALALACGSSNPTGSDAGSDAAIDQVAADAAGDAADASGFDGGVSIVEFTLPPLDAGGVHYPVDIAMGADENMWFTESNGQRIGRITPDGTIAEFPAVYGPQGITAGSDNALWFATQGKIGRIALDGGLTSFVASFEGGAPWNGWGIAEGPDSNLWVTSTTGPAAIGRMTKSGTFTVFPVPGAGPNYRPQWIAQTPAGLAFGATDPDASVLGTVSTSGSFTSFALPAGGSPQGSMGVTVGPDGNLWYTRFGAGALGHITADGGTVEFAAFAPYRLTTGPDGNLWFTDYAGDKVGRCTPSGVVTEFAIPTKGSLLLGIARGPGNTIWFTESSADKIGRVTLY